MKINLLKPQSQSSETLVLFSYQTVATKNSGKVSKKSDTTQVILNHSEAEKKFAAAIEKKSITGRVLECVVFRGLGLENSENIVIIGLGKIEELNHEIFRKSATLALDALKNLNSAEASVYFENIVESQDQAPKYVQAFSEGLKLASYEFDELKSKKSEAKEKTFHLITKFAAEAEVKKAFQHGIILADTVNFTRRLGDMPGNLMTPTILAQEAQKAARGVTNLKVTIWDKARIKRERMGGLLGVSHGSVQEPRFIIMEYKGGPKSQKPICFVGKGLTFDCGGISIKPSAAMEEMKYDMCGGANVIGTMMAISKMKLKLNVVCLVAATENLVGPAATKPGDVHTARNGKTFEVNNTDAEGRLILSDALSYATELKPQMIVDAATLTGAMVIALGNIYTGYFTRNKDMKLKIEGAADESGELVWHMPLHDEHVKDMKGTFADLSNISSGKGAGSSTAAAFLEQFVGEGIPWAHFDIAGTGWAVGNRLNYCSKKGASGVMVRTFVELAKSFE
ncbi:MAG: leucyl aminopeptidase [Pseudobdellovibrionaceae bacterium]